MIELRDFLKIFIRRRSLVFAGIAAGAALGIFFAWQEMRGVNGVVLLSVHREENPDANLSEGVAYDGYYIVETSRLFGDRLGDFLSGSELQQQFSSRHDDARIVEVRRPSSQDVAVRVHAAQEDVLADAAESIWELSDTHLALLSQETNESFIFGVTASDAVLLPPRPAVVFILFGVIVGLALGMLAAFLKEYFR